MEKAEKLVESTDDRSQQYNSFFSCQISTVCSNFRWKKRCLQANPISVLCTGDAYLWCIVVWITYICYFVSPFKSSQGLRFLAHSIFSLFPHWELKSVHFLSLSTSSVIQPAAGKQFPDFLPLKKFSLQLLQVHQSAALAKQTIIFTY